MRVMTDGQSEKKLFITLPSDNVVRKTKQLKEMKKKFFKSFVAFAAVAVVGLGSYKAHEAYIYGFEHE